MGLLHDKASQAATAGDVGAVLESIHRPEVGLATWTRALAPCVQAGAVRSIDRLTGCFHWRLTVGGLAALRSAAAPLVGNPMARDLQQLAATFFDVVRCPSILVRMERVDDDACRKFHADYKPVRLITTYVGPGTEWILRDDDPGKESAIRRLSAGHVGLFKGRAYAGFEEPFLLHRSPPIANTATTRLLAVIDVDSGVADVDECDVVSLSPDH
jgi:hypothetical protein